MKEAKTIDEQINILEKRGMVLDEGSEKAKEYLLDIGYYRLGFYCFAFETTYPKKENRTHEYQNINLSDVVKLYYLDANLRSLILKYITRIEINFKTTLIHNISVKYKNKPTWFVDPTIMDSKFIQKFDFTIYNESFRKIKVIKNHHQKYINDKYAPAWKTLEYLTFGQILTTFRALKNPIDKQLISNNFHINRANTLDNYINTIVKIRNTAAHGDVLFDFSLPIAITNKGPLEISRADNKNLNSSLKIIYYFLSIISENRKNEMQDEINTLFEKFRHNSVLKNKVEALFNYVYK